MGDFDDYRSVLYKNYSENFGVTKSFEPEKQYAGYDQIYKDLPEHKASAIADLGCGKGEWLAWLSRKGYENLTGVDVAESELQWIDKDCANLETGDVIEVMSSTEQKFDLLHAKDIFEHFTKDQAVDFLTNCLSALKPGGEIWLLTFNAQGVFSTATQYGDFTHELAVTPTSFAQVLRACGFEVVSVKGIHGTPNSIKGQLRGFLYRCIDRICGFALKLRHGKGIHPSNVDSATTLPDLFARARRPD